MMKEITTWVVENWEGVLIAIASIVSAAKAIAKLTPTQKDDSVIEKIRKCLDWVGSLNFLPDIQSKNLKK